MDVHGFLANLRSRLRRVLVLDGLAMVVMLLLSGITIAVAMDYVWTVPAALRFILLAAVCLVVVIACHRRLIRPLGRSMDDRTLAQLTERRLPTLDGRLLTQVDGIAMGEHEINVLRQQLQPSVVNSLVPAAALPGRLLLASAGLAVAVVVTLLFPQFTSDGMKRLLLPFGDTQWERHSRISGQLERLVVAEDEPIVVRLRRDAGPAAPIQLSWRPLTKHGSNPESRMLSGMTGPWTQALNLSAGQYRLLAESGDAVPLRLDALVVHRPELSTISATMTPPAYTQLPPLPLQTLGCTALPGSTLKFDIGFNLEKGRTLTTVAVKLNDTSLSTTREGTALRGLLEVKTGGVIIVEVADQDGIGMVPAPKFTLVLGDDRKPLVSLNGPRAKETVTLRARIGLSVEASDDYGLAVLALRASTYSVRGTEGDPADATAVDKPSKELLAPFADIVRQKITARQSTIVVADMAAEGERIVLLGLAEDANNITGPGKGVSQPIELKVVSETELRQELDRLLTEARDRVVQARDEIAQGLAKPERLVIASRGATMAANRAGELLLQVTRRWRENQLPTDPGAPIAKADSLVNKQALARLGEAVHGAEAPARLADTHLSEAEQILNGLLQEGDLTRILASLIERQRSLGEESRTFVREHLTKTLDEAAKTRQKNLAQRQQELSDQVKEVERRILASDTQQLEAARQLVRSATPADQLQQAAKELGSDRERPQSIPRQEASLKTLEALLEQLRGNDAEKELAARAGELAAREEALVRQLEAGAEPNSLRKEQEQLKEETEQLAKQLEKNAEQQKKAKAATQAQDAAAKAMSKSDRSGSSREASAAAQLLRAIQQELEKKSEKPEEDKEKEKNKKGPDVVKLLKELQKQQIALVADSTVVHLRIGDNELDFAASREVPALAEREADILLRIQEEGMKELEQMPVALMAVQRVSAALKATSEYLATPALGNRGMRLEKIALYELARLIDIVDNMPSPEEMEKSQGGGGGGAGQQPPFPAAAQLALLAAAQDELSVLTAANRPADLALMQSDLRTLVGVVLQGSRPNSRGALLLSRAQRAMGSAADRLSTADRGAVTRMEQEAASAAIRRLIAEAKGQQNQGSSSENSGEGEQQKQQQNQKQQGNGQPEGGKGQPGNSEPSGATAQSSKPTKQGGGTQTGVLTGSPEAGEFMHLPPERREQLKQAREQKLPPAALSIFERYLEVLENK